MTTTKKPPVIYGDDLPITTHQINTINRNCQWNVDIKEEWVQWVTGDSSRTSLKSLTQAQAIKIIRQQTGDTSPPSEGCLKGGVVNKYEDNWGLFDNNNNQHRAVLAQLRTLQWTTPSDKWGEVPDLERLSTFLKSNESPVKKPLKKMEPWEVSKIIECFKSMVTKKYK